MFFLSSYTKDMSPNESRAGLIVHTQSYTGCTMSLRSNNTRQIAGNRMPWVRDCSARKVISLVPPVGSIIMLKGGSK